MYTSEVLQSFMGSYMEDPVMEEIRLRVFSSNVSSNVYNEEEHNINEELLGGFLAGLNAGFTFIPQALTATLLAQTFPLYAVFATFFTTVVHAVLGISGQQRNVNYTVLQREVMALTASTTSLAVIIQLGLGCVGFGYIITYLSEIMMSAFLAAAALFSMLVSQTAFILGNLLAFNSGPLAIFHNIHDYCRKFSQQKYHRISRTIIQEKSGGSSQVSGLIAASVKLAMVLNLGELLQHMPEAVLAAIVVNSILPLLDNLHLMHQLWSHDKYDFGIWAVTFIVGIVCGLAIGLLILFSIVTICLSSQRMKIRLLDSEERGSPKFHTNVLDFSMVHVIDSGAVELLSEIWDVFKEFDITILIAACQSSVMKDLEINCFIDNEITKAVVCISVHDAVLFASRWGRCEEIDKDKVVQHLHEPPILFYRDLPENNNVIHLHQYLQKVHVTGSLFLEKLESCWLTGDEIPCGILTNS
ncbi:testis anion transporter 1-like [Ambystoma mexicanum]|uniref:testis anion transporter 1-like n=1 Tax=Ambystoma mexicanum TaxID=8296 RepID=UPI0037E86225